MPAARKSRTSRPKSPFPSHRELVVIVEPEAGFSARPGEIQAAGADARPVTKALDAAKASLAPLFGATEERIRTQAAEYAAATGAPPPDLSVYYTVDTTDEKMDALAEKLRGLEGIAGAYVAPEPQPPIELELLNRMTPSEEVAPPTTPDFTSRQVYLGPAPAGIDAHYAWTQPGGRGAGVRVIDVEGAWRFDHEDLTANQGGVVGTQNSSLLWRNHGTAVVGEIGGDLNAFGVTGICSDANVRGYSVFGGTGAPAAIRAAADALSAGDIILLELHYPGPDASGSGQDGYIAIEWWPAEFDAIRYAVNRGVIVVEAAGNGSRDLDAAVFNTPMAGFPPGWTNPFNRANRDSGAVIVGAGAPPPGTHGRDHGPDRSRLGFSNWGSAVDVQGWGREVTSCGYGNLQGGSDENLWYTDEFSGTSSASPIVVGALGCVQGVRRAQGQPLLTPATARSTLRSTGTPQQDAPGRPATQRIGNRPNLRQVLGGKVLLKEFKERGKDKLEKVERKEVKLEKPERKEVKLEKNEKVERKEKEVKLEKNEKVERKEFKEVKLEKNETEIEDKRRIEIDKRKDAMGEVDFERFREEMLRRGGGGPGTDVGERLEALESAVSQLTHFISGELRPDLGEGALSQEPDAGAFGKVDVEKLSEF